MEMKLDLVSVYDNVQWSFLCHCLNMYGIKGLCCDFSMHYLSTTSMAIKINGGPTEFFQLNRGLRQADPLSPILFLFVMNNFSLYSTYQENLTHIGIKINHN